MGYAPPCRYLLRHQRRTVRHHFDKPFVYWVRSRLRPKDLRAEMPVLILPDYSRESSFTASAICSNLRHGPWGGHLASGGRHACAGLMLHSFACSCTCSPSNHSRATISRKAESMSPQRRPKDLQGSLMSHVAAILPRSGQLSTRHISLSAHGYSGRSGIGQRCYILVLHGCDSIKV